MLLSITSYTPKNPPKGILFDLDGTLVNTAPDILGTVNDVLEKRGFKQRADHSMIGMAGDGIGSFISKLTGLNEKSVRFQELRHAMFHHYRTRCWQDSHIFAGVEQLLAELSSKQIPWGIVTNKTEMLTMPMLKKLGWDKQAKAIVCADTTAYKKPHPDPMLYAAACLNIAPQDCLYLGDAKRDILAAKAAKMPVIAASYGYVGDENFHKWPADAYIENMGEFINWLQHQA